MVALLTCLAVLSAPSTSRPLTNPTDVRSVTRGAQAVFSDPAAPAASQGLEIAGRGQVDSDTERRDYGLALSLPVAKGALYGAYEWIDETTPMRRLSLGFAVPLLPALTLGVAYRRWSMAGDDANVFDAGLLAEPSRYVSLALGLDQINAPRFALPGIETGRLRRAWRFGVALRPVGGAPWFTLGADTRLIRRAASPEFVETRVLAELEPVPGLRLLAAYATPRQAWLGVALALDHAEAMGTSGARFAGPTDLFAQSAAALTLHAAPARGLVAGHGRSVEMTLNGDLRAAAEGWLGGEPEPISSIALRLEELADDPTVSEVVLNIGDLEVGLATVEDVRAAIARLRAAGKSVLALLHGGGEKEYLIAAAANRISLDPATDLELDGFSVTMLYFAEALSKIGVRVESVAVGRYKTAPDALTSARARPEEREVMGDVLAASFARLAQALNRDRGLDANTIDGIISRGLVTAEEALALHLVDELSQPLDPHAVPVLRERGESVVGDEMAQRTWGERPALMIVPVIGNIVLGEGGALLPGGTADARRIVADLERARTDGAVRGVVLRVDSPGGDVYAAELIWRAVRLLAEAKPVVVSMGDVAASGGYYVAAPAHLILAQPSTLTGSIGIFMLKPDLSGLLGLAGINAEILKVGPLADWSSLTKGLSAPARAQLQRGLDAHYRAFLARVAAGRGLEMPYVESIAQGRVYTGEQALERKLIDAIGGLADALREVALRAQLGPGDDVNIIVPERPFSLSALAGTMASTQSSWANVAAQSLRGLRQVQRRAWARMPYELEVGE